MAVLHLLAAEAAERKFYSTSPAQVVAEADGAGPIHHLAHLEGTAVISSAVYCSLVVLAGRERFPLEVAAVAAVRAFLARAAQEGITARRPILLV